MKLDGFEKQVSKERIMVKSIAARDWKSPVGVPGDLADVIVGTLSLASLSGLKKVSKPEFYGLFLQLQKDFPDLFPQVVFTHTGKYVYSKALGDALERALRLGVDVMNPRFYYIGVEKKEDADRNLELICENTGTEFVERLRPVAVRLAELAQTLEPRA